MMTVKDFKVMGCLPNHEGYWGRNFRALMSDKCIMSEKAADCAAQAAVMAAVVFWLSASVAFEKFISVATVKISARSILADARP